MAFPLGILVMSVSLPLVFLGAIVSTLVIPRYLDRFRFLIFLFPLLLFLFWMPMLTSGMW